MPKQINPDAEPYAGAKEPAPEPPYRHLTVGEGFRRAYDKDGHLVDEQTGKRLDVNGEEAPPKRRPGRPKKGS